MRLLGRLLRRPASFGRCSRNRGWDEPSHPCIVGDDWDDQHEQCYALCTPYCLRHNYCYDDAAKEDSAYAPDLESACPGGDVRASDGVACEDVAIPGLVARLGRYRAARVCAPRNATGPLPLHVLAHGDGGGGALLGAYDALAEQIAAAGFVVAAYASCSFDAECDNGETSWLEILKTLAHLADDARVDAGRGFSASGHSTGARAALMVAAARDDPGAYAAPPELRAALANVRAVVGDHPDPMRDPARDPNVTAWRAGAISRTPAMLVTGAWDLAEPVGSVWDDFVDVTGDKVFLDVARATHMGYRSPVTTHPEGAWIAAFLAYYVRGDAAAGAAVFGGGPASLSRAALVAARTARNAGTNPPFLACRDKSATPPDLARFC